MKVFTYLKKKYQHNDNDLMKSRKNGISQLTYVTIEWNPSHQCIVASS